MKYYEALLTCKLILIILIVSLGLRSNFTDFNIIFPEWYHHKWGEFDLFLWRSCYTRMWKVIEVLRLRSCAAQSIKSKSSRIQNDFWRNRITFNITFYKREIGFLILCYLHEIRFHLITCRCCVFITSINLLSQFPSLKKQKETWYSEK